MRRHATYSFSGVDTPVRRPRTTLWLLRAVVTVHLVAVLGQPVWAGMFLTGDVDAIGAHGAIGSAMAALGLVTMVVAVAYSVGGRGSLWAVPLAVAWFLGVGFQIGAGYGRNLGVHLPLGVALAVVAVLVAVWAWSPAAARPRRARPVPAEPAAELVR
jgi:uncharacterized membrane protein (UPF0182 family)